MEGPQQPDSHQRARHHCHYSANLWRVPATDCEKGRPSLGAMRNPSLAKVRVALRLPAGGRFREIEGAGHDSWPLTKGAALDGESEKAEPNLHWRVTATLVSGHDTPKVLTRYNIVSLKNVQDAGAKVGRMAQQTKQAEGRALTPPIQVGMIY